MRGYVYGEGGDPRHDHVVFETEDGTRIVYNDARRFGYMLILKANERDSHPLFRQLGPEPLKRRFHGCGPRGARAGQEGQPQGISDGPEGRRRISGTSTSRRLSIAPHCRRTAPRRTLSDAKGRATERAGRLVQAIREMLEDAIAAGGSTLRDYRHADGTSGSFQERFYAYDRDGERACKRDAGERCAAWCTRARATFYCPRCQR